MKINAEVELGIDAYSLDDIVIACCLHADSSPYEYGDNYWRTCFVDKLQEELEKNLIIGAVSK
jgi:hypothetical protein